MARALPPYASIPHWVAWATFAWALIAWFVVLPVPLQWPRPIYVAALLSGGMALIGGVIGLLYVSMLAPTRSRVLSGSVATFVNLIYLLIYADAIMHNPP